MISIWESAMINIVIPMAGLGSRFSNAGYSKPKPFIDVGGKTMIERVLDNLWIPEARFILLAKAEHILKYANYVSDIRKRYSAEFYPVNYLTQGTACTVMLARDLINNDTPLIVANSDQIVDIDFEHFLKNAQRRALDGSILTFHDQKRDPKWSFARLDDSGLVVEVREKEAISDHATVGIYYFKRGSDFIEGTIEMMLAQDTVNGEYYTCPVYNYMIEENRKVGIYKIAENQMHGLGTPEDLKTYLTLRHS